MAKYGFDMQNVATQAAGAAVSGIGRSMVAAKVNPGSKGLPVAKQAWWFDGVSALVGLGLTYFGQEKGSETMEALGQGLLIPGVAGLAADAAHDVNRRWNPDQPAPAVPTQVMAAQAAQIPADTSLYRGQSVMAVNALASDF